MDLVPSLGWETGLKALDRLLEGKRSVSAAVAFVSRSGAEALCGLIDRHSSVEDVYIVARGAPITDPNALLEIKETLGASVALIHGSDANQFHPKLWLLEADDGALDVLSGSGNLTKGGLSANREQFEVLQATDGGDIDAQWQRFASLTAGAVPLEDMLGSVAWREWELQLPQRRQLAAEQKRLDERLAKSAAENMNEAKDILRKDLWAIHNRTLAAKLPKPEGGTYNPGHFRLELEGHRGVTDPVHIVGRICRRRTKGFDIIKASGHVDLTVESLVVDPQRPYYELFKGDVRNLAEQRLKEQFPDWEPPASA
jgi:HKD family nuclease